MRKLTNYVLKKAKGSCIKIRPGTGSEAIGHTPVEDRTE